MATNQMLQWQSHITDSTDQGTILGNLDFLEDFAGAIMGDETLHDNFEAIRKGIENGTLKPTDWKTSPDFTTIITELKNASSGKLSKQAKKISDQAQKISDQGDTLTQYGKTITSHGTRLDTAETDIDKKLDSKTFEDFKGGDFKIISDWKGEIDKIGKLASMKEFENLKTLLNNEVSHWTAESAPAPAKDYLPAAQIKASTQPWGKNEDPARHVNDLCTVIGEGQKDKGVSYRFITNPDASSYKWVKVIDNDGALALSKHATFVQTYNQRQTDINNALEKKQPKGDYVTKTDWNKKQEELAKQLGDYGTEIEDQRKKAEERDKQYKVVVTTKGYIKDGEIVDGDSDNGTPVIVHTAHVYDNFGKEKNIEARNKLTWTINKGRTSAPIEKTITGLVCKVSKEQFVKDGTTPPYYNIELNSTF